MAKKNNNTILWVAGAAIAAYFIYKNKKAVQSSNNVQLVNAEPTTNTTTTNTNGGDAPQVVQHAQLPVVFTPPINNEPINPNIPHYNSSGYGGENFMQPVSNTSNDQTQNFLNGFKQMVLM